MSIPRYYTVGAVARDVRALKALDERLEDLGVTADPLLVFSRRKDERLVGVTLPDVRTRRVESGLSRAQWFELASTYLGVTAVSVLMGAFHPPTGIAVQAVMTLAVIMGLPERFAEEWEGAFHDGFALALATVPSDLFDEMQDAFLQAPGIESPFALDRRPVL